MIIQNAASLNPKSLPGPHDIIRTQLDNGITLLVRPNSNTLSVSIAGYLQAGSMYDPLEKLGLADFTASTLMRGTKSWGFRIFMNNSNRWVPALESTAGRTQPDSGENPWLMTCQIY